jgi:hypothetical protein
MPQPEAPYDTRFLLPAEHRKWVPGWDTSAYVELQRRARKVAAEVRATTPPEWTWLHGKNLG